MKKPLSQHRITEELPILSYRAKFLELLQNHQVIVVSGETGSGKIVEELKRKVEEFEHEIAILDSSAGIGCPVIASIRGSDYAVLIAEPTPSGFSDLKRVLEIVNYFHIPYGIVVNKWDINPEISNKIEKWSKEKFLGKISYDKKVIESIVNLKPIIYSESKVVEEIEKIFEKIKTLA